MSERKPSLYELIEKLFREVESGELQPDSLREAIEDARDMGQLTARQHETYARRLEQLERRT